MTNAEMDRLLATEVMGWGFAGETYYKAISEGHARSVHSCYSWKPSQKIDQAFMVVEKLREKSLWLSLSQMPGKHPRWRAIFVFGGMAVGDRSMAIAVADTPAEAICRAAIEVILANNPQP
jgi:hypothetical protein